MDFNKKGLIVFLLFLVTQQFDCASHYYRSGQLCLECSSNCQECFGVSTYCLSCQGKYYLSNNTCTICSEQCSSCNNSLICSACNLGSYLKNGRCAECMNNCDTCNETACFTCQDGYSFASNCILCVNGYFWNNIYSVCNKCSSGCKTCTGLTSCSACLDNYLNEKGTCRYNGPSSTSSDNSQIMIFIIIGAVAGGILALACFIYIIYRCVAPKKTKKEVNAQSSQVSIGPNQSQSICQQLSDRLGCSVCNEINAEIRFNCGHQFHQGCIKDQAKHCSLCPKNLPEKQIYLDQIQNVSEVHSEESSEQSRKQAYLDSSTVKDTNAQMQIVNLGEE